MDSEPTPIVLPQDMTETINAIYTKAKNINPKLTQNDVVECILKEWLLQYKRDKHSINPKSKVRLKNRLRQAIELCGKTQTAVAREVGISRTYLGHVIRGESDPSVTVALLLVDVVNYPLEKFNEVFYLEPVE